MRRGVNIESQSLDSYRRVPRRPSYAPRSDAVKNEATPRPSRQKRGLVLTNEHSVRYAPPMPTAEPALLYEKRDGIAVLTMNRPEVRNALNAEMLCRLADAWQDVNDDPAVRVAILTGAGEDAFCAGADLDRLVRMMQGLRPPETEFDERIIKDVPLIYKGLARTIEIMKPVIAAVKGFCVAGGTEILQVTD